MRGEGLKKVILLYGEANDLHAKVFSYPLRLQDARKILRLVTRLLRHDSFPPYVRLFKAERAELLTINLADENGKSGGKMNVNSQSA
jgi:hypothetical protein